MFLGARVNEWSEDGPEVRIHCPYCGERDVVSRSRVDRSENFVLHAVLLYRTQLRLVECGHCGRILECDEDLERLRGDTADETQPHLRPRDGFVAKSIAWIGLALCWIPFLGLVPALLVCLANWRSRGVAWRLSSTSLKIAGGLTGLAVVVAVVVEILQRN